MYWNNDIALSFLNSLNPWSRFLLEKLLFSHVVKKFTVFYGTWWLITLFTWTSHFPSTDPDHTCPPPPSYALKIRLNIILPTTPVSSKWSFSLAFPSENPVFTAPTSRSCTYPALLIFIDFITQKIELGVKIMQLSSLYIFLQSHRTFYLFGPNIFHHNFSQTPSVNVIQ